MRNPTLTVPVCALVLAAAGCDRGARDEAPRGQATAGAEETRAAGRGGVAAVAREGSAGVSDADFARYDLDQDGRISTDEWNDVDVRYTWDSDRDGRINDIELSTALYTAWDVDGNDRIDLVEFRDGSALWLADDAEIDLGTWDTNTDGALDHDELEAGLRSVSYRDAWDTDGDDSVTWREVQTGVYRARDADGDGHLDADEWR